MRVAVIAALILNVATVAAQQPGPPASVTRISGEMFLEEPQTNCAVADAAASLAIATGVPFGIERLPRCEPSVHGAAQRVAVAGLTLREALDRLAALHPRYSWREDGGVIVVRPSQEWDRVDHFLNQTVPSFAYQRLNIGSAHAVVNTLLGPNRLENAWTRTAHPIVRGDSICASARARRSRA